MSILQALSMSGPCRHLRDGFYSDGTPFYEGDWTYIAFDYPWACGNYGHAILPWVPIIIIIIATVIIGLLLIRKEWKGGDEMRKIVSMRVEKSFWTQRFIVAMSFGTVEEAIDALNAVKTTLAEKHE